MTRCPRQTAADPARVFVIAMGAVVRLLQNRRGMKSSPRVALLLSFALLSLTIACGGGSPTSPSNVAITVTGTGATSVTYTANVQSIFASDCVPCHGPSQRQAGYDFSTYAGALKALTPGSDQSMLVRVTQPNGLMYVNFSGNRSQKAGIIYDWVVNSKAAQ